MQKIKDFKDNFVKGRKINYHDLNDILKISKKILKIFLILIFVLSFYICVRVFKELNIIGVILTILSTLKPFFIGIIIAWLFNPIVNYLQKKGIRRVIGTSLSYVALILILFLIIGNIIPLAYEQLKDLSNLLPTILDNAQNLINNIFNHFNSTDLVNIDMVKDKLYNLINNYTNGIYNTLPNTLFGVAKSVISGTGAFLLGMLIGFFLLLGFNNINQSLKKEKEVGQEFDEKFVQTTIAYGNQLEKINEAVANNVKIVVNPSIEDLRNYVNFYKSNQRDDQTFNIRINGSPSQRSIELFYKGYNVSEKIPKVVFEYTSEEAFDSNSIFEIVMLYANDNETLSSVNEVGKYVNVSSNGDSLEINDMSIEFTDNVDKSINDMQKNDQVLYEKNNAKKLVRKLDNIASAQMLKIFVLIFIIFVIIFLFVLFKEMIF